MKTKFSKANTPAYPSGERNLFQTLRETFLFRMQNLFMAKRKELWMALHFFLSQWKERN